MLDRFILFLLSAIAIFVALTILIAVYFGGLYFIENYPKTVAMLGPLVIIRWFYYEFFD